MRRFSSYGPVDTKLHYYAPRKELVESACASLLGEDPSRGGHYITVWAPRQRGKTWVMQQVVGRLSQDERFHVLKIGVEHLLQVTEVNRVAQIVGQAIIEGLELTEVAVNDLNDLSTIFRREVLKKPLILIIDEFDALPEAAITGIVRVFRNIYNSRQGAADRPSAQQEYLLHSVALIGVRGVLGIENRSGSPFNVQRSLHIPDLTFAEVESMFRWYEQESGQPVEQAVIDRLYYEIRGQPGLTSWLGELMTETYKAAPGQPLSMAIFEQAYGAALHILPNANILNLISKARQEPYNATVLELFKTDAKIPFYYDDPHLNFLYQNGVIEWEQERVDAYVVKFPSPFVQKRLFHYFARQLVAETGRLYAPFEDLTEIVGPDGLDVVKLLGRFERYLQENREWLLRDAPRKSNLRPYEAVYHFILYRYLADFLQGFQGQVWPEFPTGNGKVDLLIECAGQRYGLEVKSFTTLPGYRQALLQAASYGRQLGQKRVTLAFFLEAVDDANRARYETLYLDSESGVEVAPVFVQTGT